MATTPAQKTTAAAPGLKRSLSVWQAVGLSLALMAPSINPQGAIGAGRAVPLAFLLAPRTARRLGAAPMSREGISR